MAFESPLEELLKKQAETLGEKSPIENQIQDIDLDDDVYGKNDLAKEIEEEENAEQQEAEAAAQLFREMKEIEEAQHNQPVIDSNDKGYQNEAIGFQGDKLAIVTTMVNKVIAKYHIVEGAVPEDVMRLVMGELVDEYHNSGEEITPRFEEIILKNWMLPSGVTAYDAIQNGTLNTAKETQTPVQETTKEDVEEPEEKNVEEPISININVEPNTPVTVNVDDSIVSEINKSSVINVNVREVSNKDLKSTTIITNSKMEGIIKPYKFKVNNVPITLPMSAYRLTATGLNYFEVIDLSSPTSGTISDNEMKNWSIIYDHIQNVSIGEFENFEDFLKATKYSDRELLMWAILVATVDNEEEIGMLCSNENCEYTNYVKYYPRNIVHLNEKLIPSYYMEANKVSVGDAARKLHGEVAGKTRYMTLPDSKVMLEIKTPSAYDYIYRKLPLISDLYKETHKGNLIETSRGITDDRDTMYTILVSVGLYVNAVLVPSEGKYYRYDTWDNIRKVITTAISKDDTAIVLNLVSSGKFDQSPVEFYIEDVVCPNCGRHDKRAVIRNVFEELLFRASRKLQNTQINLIDNPEN